jgi:transposase
VENLLIVDSTTISLFGNILKGAGRNPLNGQKKGGIKAHVMINALQDVPTLVNFSSAATHDHVFLKALDLQKGSFVVFDKAYVDYQQYDQWSQEGIFFVTRLKENAAYRSIEEFEVPENMKESVLKDEHIVLVRKDKSEFSVRRVVFFDQKKDKTYEFVTNHFELTPDKIADIYKNRWQIETMFKRLKQNFPLKYFLGESQNAIEIQIWVSLMVQLIVLVIQKSLKRKWAFSNMLSIIRYHLTSYIHLTKFLEDPDKSWKDVTTKPPDQPELFPN